MKEAHFIVACINLVYLSAKKYSIGLIVMNHLLTSVIHSGCIINLKQRIAFIITSQYDYKRYISYVSSK